MLIEITYNVTDVYMSTTETPVYVEISFEQPGSASAVWGSITGTLSNQTDLQNALNAKLDESTIDGGTEGQILSKASGTDFDFAWINNYAKYLATNVRNQTGSTIGAFQVVYISGATGNKPLISLADADTEATSSKTYGVTATAIANNGTGDVVTAGELSGIDTSAFNEGDLLWLSTTAGGVVTSPPAEPAHAVFIGYVIRSHPTLGVIDVAIANGYELNELHGVQITTPTDNQGLFYNSTSTLWENKSITTALGYTPVSTTRNITINGVTYDLSADRTWTIAAGISGSGASGQVTYWTGASAVSGSSALLWDNTNSRLAIGAATTWNAGIGALSVVNSTSDAPILSLKNIDATKQVYYASYNNADKSLQYIVYGSTAPGTIFGQFRANAAVILGYNTPSYLAIGNFENVPLIFGNNNQERFRVTTSGNVSIGTTSDLGTRLGVVGDTLLRGSGATSATTALTVQNSSSVNILRVLNDGQTILRGTTNNDTTNIFRIEQQNGNGRFLVNANGQTIIAGDAFTSSETFVTVSRGNFNPTSGTATHTSLAITPTINQTGGANGITRGLYVNPTLTAAADWRSIEWSNNTGWGLYGAGTANNYLAGRLGIGSLVLSGVGGAYNLRVSRNISGSVYSGGVSVDGTIQSDATISAWGYSTFISTQAATFNIANLSHFVAEVQTWGAGSTATNQYGFFVTNTLTTATNNYGFYGNIASGTGRWNLYMGGTADNYLAGNLGIGITPTVRLQVSGDTILRGSGATSATTALTVQNSNSQNLFTLRNDGFSILYGNSQIASALPYLQLTPSAWGSSFYLQSGVNIAANAAGDYTDFLNPVNRGYAFIQGSTASMVIAPTTSNVSIGTTSDLGVRLGVVGDTLLRGSGNTSATTALTVQNSSSTVLGRFQNDGAVSIGAGGWLTIGEGQRYLYRSVNLSGIFSIANDSNVASRIDFYGSSHATRPNTIELRSSFSPTSGSVEHSTWAMVSTINQTGGANGITRGLYVNPTLTSAADFRAIETTNGKIVFGNLPTSSAGLPTGALWNDAGTVKIV